MGTQLIVHVPIQTEMLENKKIYFQVYQNQESCFDLWKDLCRVNFLRLKLLMSFLKQKHNDYSCAPFKRKKYIFFLLLKV